MWHRFARRKREPVEKTRPQKGRPKQGVRPSSAGSLTSRQVEVLGLMAEGLTNAEIGEALFVSEETIKTHVRLILAQLNARNRTHAVALGFRGGWLSMS